MTDIISVQGLPLLACLTMIAILGYTGIHVLKREIIFIDIALAQIAAVGAIAAHVLFHLHGHSLYAHALAFASTLVAAGFFALVRRRVVQIPLEAVIGVSYAVSAAAALFLVGIAPGGHVHVQEMLAGSILWATWSDVLVSAGVFVLVGFCFYRYRRPFQEITEDYGRARARGYNTLGWDFLFYALLGGVITIAVRVAGVVLVFAFLIIPAALSTVFASGWSTRVVVAWIAGALSAVLGLLFAARYDFSVGPAIALFLGLLLIAAGLLRRAHLTRRRTAVVLLLGVAMAGVWLGAGAVGGDGQRAGGYGGAPSAGAITHSHSGEGDSAPPLAAVGHETAEIPSGQLEEITDVDQLESLYAETVDVEHRSMVIARALEVDVRAGARVALAFLEEDPPLLFRMTVVDKLSAAAHWRVPYDIHEPFAAPANQEAVAELRDRLTLK